MRKVAQTSVTFGKGECKRPTACSTPVWIDIHGDHNMNGEQKKPQEPILEDRFAEAIQRKDVETV